MRIIWVNITARCAQRGEENRRGIKEINKIYWQRPCRYFNYNLKDSLHLAIIIKILLLHLYFILYALKATTTATTTATNIDDEEETYGLWQQINKFITFEFLILIFFYFQYTTNQISSHLSLPYSLTHSVFVNFLNFILFCSLLLMPLLYSWLTAAA